MEAMGVQNAVIAVTNAGHGFGLAVARAFGHAGANVIVIDQNGEDAAGVASEIEAAGGRAIPIKADLTVQLEVSVMFEKCRQIFGTLSGLVHVADKTSQTAFTKMQESEWTDLLDNDARSSYLVLRALGRTARNAWATLILPPDDHAEPQVRAVRGYLTEFVLGLAARGVRVNAIVPNRSAGSLELDAALADAAVTLALPGSTGISGAVVRVKLPPLPDPRASLPRDVIE
jgi:NAD(P)-dependent dehydrogenase (short-subunit alcohol dehydrogenase family)